ncbi:MAG: preprotein translocase subunit YajC [Phycisphaerales bacterium]|jgi:preprotein translocase subunit YajC|nr:preprotein translocase subunit YajC [Phycisphaerales bacterium]
METAWGGWAMGALGGAEFGTLTLGQDAGASSGGPVVVPSFTEGDAAGGGASTGAADAGQGATAPRGPDPFMFLLPLMVVFLVFMMFRGASAEKKRQKARNDMLSALGKHDKVATLGGIVGTIVEMGEEEVVLKSDETSGTRIRVLRSSIDRVLRPHKSGGASGALEPKGEDARVGSAS